MSLENKAEIRGKRNRKKKTRTHTQATQITANALKIHAVAQNTREIRLGRTIVPHTHTPNKQRVERKKKLESSTLREERKKKSTTRTQITRKKKLGSKLLLMSETRKGGGKQVVWVGGDERVCIRV